MASTEKVFITATFTLMFFILILFYQILNNQWVNIIYLLNI